MCRPTSRLLSNDLCASKVAVPLSTRRSHSLATRRVAGVDPLRALEHGLADSETRHSGLALRRCPYTHTPLQRLAWRDRPERRNDGSDAQPHAMTDHSRCHSRRLSRPLWQEAATCCVRVDPCSPISAAPRSPQSCNLRVGPQLPPDIITAGPEDDAGGAPGLELRETFAQFLARPREGHLFGGGHVDERVVAV